MGASIAPALKPSAPCCGLMDSKVRLRLSLIAGRFCENLSREVSVLLICATFFSHSLKSFSTLPSTPSISSNAESALSLSLPKKL